MIGYAVLFRIKCINSFWRDGYNSLVGPSPLVDLRAKEGYSLKDFLLVTLQTYALTCLESGVEAIRKNRKEPLKSATKSVLTKIDSIFAISRKDVLLILSHSFAQII